MKQPREIRRVEGEGLHITWSTGETKVLSNRTLREHCPCAECKERRGEGSHDKPLSGPKKKGLAVIQHTVQEEIDLKRVWAVGTYAVGIEWGDGHATGIYTYDYLSEL